MRKPVYIAGRYLFIRPLGHLDWLVAGDFGVIVHIRRRDGLIQVLFVSWTQAIYFLFVIFLGWRVFKWCPLW